MWLKKFPKHFIHVWGLKKPNSLCLSSCALRCQFSDGADAHSANDSKALSSFSGHGHGTSSLEEWSTFIRHRLLHPILFFLPAEVHSPALRGHNPCDLIMSLFM